MKTSMGYRLFRLYFNDHSNDFELFGSRVHNPKNPEADQPFTHANSTAILRTALAILIIGTIVLASQV